MIRTPAALAAIALSSISALAAPSLTTPPLATTVTAGQNATFSVAATGSGTLTYQWRRNESAISGATAATFVLPRVSRVAADSYDVVVTDSTGSTTSTPVALSVRPTQYPTALGVDSSLNSIIEKDANFTVSAMAPLANGGFYAAGSFSHIGTLAAPGIARFTPDAQIDSTFAPSSFDGPVTGVVALPDGGALVCGKFTHVGGKTAKGVVRLGTDGSVDSSFQPALPGNPSIWLMKRQADGRILVVDQSQNMAVIRLNADGSKDSTFASGVAAGGIVLAMQSDGKILLAGFGLGASLSNYGLVRLNTDGTKDTTFSGVTFDLVPFSIAVAPDNSIYVAGVFHSVNGVSVSGLVHLSRDGAVDTSFKPAITYSSGFDGSGNAVAVQSDGKVLFGGSFDLANGIARRTLVRLNADGTTDTSFVLSSPVDSGSTAHDIEVLSDGSILLGLQNGGLVPTSTASHGLVKLTATGIITANYTMRSTAWVTSVLPLDDGKFLVGGLIDRVNGSIQAGVARLNADLTIDPTFSLATAGYQIEGLTRLSDGRIAAMGAYYASVGANDPISSGLLIIDRDGALLSSISPSTLGIGVRSAIAAAPGGKAVIAGSSDNLYAVTLVNADGSVGWTQKAADSTINALVAQPDGKILVGGWFTHFGSAAARYLVRLKADGTLDSSFTPPVLSSGVLSLALTSQGQVIVGTGSSGIVRLYTDGSRDTTWNQNTSRGVFGLLVQDDGAVIAACRDSDVSLGAGLARYSSDGTLDATFYASGSLSSANASTIVMRDNGQLLATGVTPSLGLYISRPGIAPTFTTSPSSQHIAVGSAVTLSAATADANGVSYQWFLNGSPIAGATSATYAISDFRVASAGSYTVRATNEFGVTTSAAASVSGPIDHRGRIINASIRSAARTGDATLIVGFTLGGDGTGGDKPIVVRGVGPTLTAFGLPGALDDPMIELYDVGGTKIDENDDWAGVLNFSSIGGFPFAGVHPKDAAIYNPFARNGIQTMHVIAKPGSSGVVLAELYDANAASDFTVFTPRIINCSARSFSDTGDNALILGFVVDGATPVKVLVRAAGPALGKTPFNISGVLADPRLEVYASKTKIAENDNWEDGASGSAMRDAFQSVSAFGFGAGTKDSAIILTLNAGSYSAVVRGVNDTTGIAIVELYELPQ